MATRNDVAKLAGVSGATVSRVLSNPEVVSESTRAKVMDAVRALDYHPSYSGQMLKQKQTRQILFFCPDLFNPFYVHVFYGMDDYAQEHGYNIVLSRHFDKISVERGRYDGVILCALEDKEFQSSVEYLNSLSIPFVTAAFYKENINVHSVSIDYQQSTSLAVNHLYELGHRNIAYVSDTSSFDAKYNAVNNQVRLKSDMNCQRMVLTPAPELYPNHYEAGSLYAEQILREISQPTAVIAANDAIATGLLSGLTSVGLHVPADLSVIGFDDTHLSRFTIPALTTVRFPKYEMGQALIELLLSVISKEDAESVLLPSILVKRGSTAKLIT